MKMMMYGVLDAERPFIEPATEQNHIDVQLTDHPLTCLLYSSAAADRP